ncbi:T-cell surface glycoprotein CD3 gamma chain-like [Sphaeramia orbicularis]|uniref:T-cell surface glycoprotein CD3 gamma chain-like n=1 Tax=Sphaeramia orbicularis TaxID=375764 RepID=A0A673A281_9TELE|nr:T-cell surface glycoprotein CD3 gamma chain-like [Sphaeramia orbicularis]
MSKNTINLKVLLPRCLLLLWTLTAFVSSEDKEIQVGSLSDGIKLTCPDGQTLHRGDVEIKTEKIDYKDENTGEYICKTDGGDTGKAIFVKFRTCDNCVDLNMASVSGMIVGDIVATIVIGVAVYLIASQANRTGSVTSNKKSSDRQHLMPNEVSNRPTNDQYQQLRYKKGQKDTYDVLTNRR